MPALEEPDVAVAQGIDSVIHTHDVQVAALVG